MDIGLMLDLFSNMSLIAVAAYLFGRNRFVINCANRPYTLSAWLTLTVIFAALSMISTYYGKMVEGGLASTRIIGTLMGGIMGGPVVGFSVGLIGGIHRYFVGGFTAVPCAIATVLGGLFAGLVRQRTGLANLTWKTAATVAFLAEVMQKTMTIAFAKPFEAAWAMEKAIALPTTLVTVVGTVVFVLILKDLQSQLDLSGAKAAQLSLDIASRTLGYLRHGLTVESAQKTAAIIYDLTKADAVAITDKEKILAFIGEGSDHHVVGQPIISQSTKQVLASGKLAIFHTAAEQGCAVPDCPLQCGVIAPLLVRGSIVGTIKIYKVNANGMTAFNTRIADGLANLLSAQIELAEIDIQSKLREKAELKALQAQINPHFLFNTINIIMSFCRTSPDTARSLLGHLATMMHFNFAKHHDLVTIEEELESVRAYLEIAKARFGPRLTVDIQVDAAATHIKIPVLSLQPLVENAILHGLFPKVSECNLSINIKSQDYCVYIRVADNGVGMEPEQLAQLLKAQSSGIGIANVNRRLVGLYGEYYKLKIDSAPNLGTTATICIPLERRAIQDAS